MRLSTSFHSLQLRSNKLLKKQKHFCGPTSMYIYCTVYTNLTEHSIAIKTFYQNSRNRLFCLCGSSGDTTSKKSNTN